MVLREHVYKIFSASIFIWKSIWKRISLISCRPTTPIWVKWLLHPYYFVFVCYILWTCFEQNIDRGRSLEIETLLWMEVLHNLLSWFHHTVEYVEILQFTATCYIETSNHHKYFLDRKITGIYKQSVVRHSSLFEKISQHYFYVTSK